MDINELTYKINGAIYEVNRILGSGFLAKAAQSGTFVQNVHNFIIVAHMSMQKIMQKVSSPQYHLPELRGKPQYHLPELPQMNTQRVPQRNALRQIKYAML
jgi:hypothetical protein